MWQIQPMEFFQVLIWKMVLNLNQLQFLLWISIIINTLPTVTALPEERPVPEIPFKLFSQFIQDNFSSRISLSRVLVILFTMTDNTDLLNLHSRQQNHKCTGEKHVTMSSWMKCLARVMDNKLYKQQDVRLLKKSDNVTKTETRINNIGTKLDALAKPLDLNPYNDKGQFQQKLKPVSHKSIDPIHVIYPNSYECETLSCQPQSLLQITKS
jgi:hypothetical protein